MLAVLTLFPIAAASQKRKSTASQKRTTTPAATTSAVNEARNNGATQVATQIKNLTRFLYVYAGVAKDLQAVDSSVQRGEASQAVKDQSAKSKATVQTSLVNVRDGLDHLEITFRTTPALQPYYIKLAGSAAGAATAEQLATSGQYDRSARTLIDVVNRLADVLVAMRQT
jgi:hypothetical protein